MEIIRTFRELSEVLQPARDTGKTIGLVPTMGALHAGHMSLVKRARADNDIVVVSVFVNPTQFNNPDDLRTYPRCEEADCAMLEAAGVDYAFVPEVADVYPEPDKREFDLGPVAQVMEGAMRPGHFNGVCQIVSKLFDGVRPDRAYFGEKDFQQIAVIKRMVELEGHGPQIVPCPIVREADGLALSSRNVRLTPGNRQAAPAIHRVLAASRDLRDKGLEPAEVEREVIREVDSVPGMRVEYFTIADALTMQPLACWADAGKDGAVGCITVFAGDVRLIDNIRY